MIDYTGYKYDGPTDAFVIEVTGKLDTTTSDYLLDCLQGYIERGEKNLVLDCSELEYISSIGLAVLVRASSRLKSKGGQLAIAGVKGLVADSLRIVHFDRLFHLFPDVDAAAKSFAA